MHSLKSISYHVGPVVYLCQGFVSVGIGVEIGISAVRVDFLSIRRKLINVKASFQLNRILIHKPTRIRLVIPEEIVMQSGLFIKILVLQTEGLVSAIRYLGFLF